LADSLAIVGELNPKFEQNVITVATIYPGASPSEVENTVTKKLRMQFLENIKKLTLNLDLSTVSITLNSSAEVDVSLNDAQ
jgi:HAE1 family hydrophobic/amphiphilic exporter-1